MRSIFLSFFPVYPPDSGAGSVTYNCAKNMPGERWLVQFGHGTGSMKLETNFSLHTLPWAEGRFTKISRLPVRIYKMVRICRQIDPDLIVLEGASWVMYHWLLLKALQKAKLKAKIVYHAHNVEYDLRRQKHSPIITRLTGLAEGKLFWQTDHDFACSEVDQDRIEKLYGIRPGLLPNGVDAESFEKVSEDEITNIRSRYRLQGVLILFMGMYDYLPNKEAIDFLVLQVMPQIIEFKPEIRLVVLGGKTPYERPWLIQPGKIPHQDLPAFVKSCDVGVAPIFSGSGTRLKILEYMAAGLPVVATTKGAEGLDLINRKQIILADDVKTFSDTIGCLIENFKQAEQLGSEGRNCIKTRYAWPALMSAFSRQVNRIYET